MEDVKRVVIPTDGSENARPAQRRGFALARLLGRPVLGVYVIDAGAIQPFPNEALVVDLRGILEGEAQKALESLRAEGRAAGVAVETTVVEGHPEEEIVRVAGPTDLIVLATHGRRGLSRLLLGSVAEHVVRNAPCPVLVVPHRPR